MTSLINAKLNDLSHSIDAIMTGMEATVQATTLILEKLDAMEARLTRMIDRLDKMDTGVRSVAPLTDRYVHPRPDKWRPK